MGNVYRKKQKLTEIIFEMTDIFAFESEKGGKTV